MGKKNNKRRRDNNRNRWSLEIPSDDTTTKPEQDSDIKIEQPTFDGAVNEKSNVAAEGATATSASAQVFKEDQLSLDLPVKEDCRPTLEAVEIDENVPNVLEFPSPDLSMQTTIIANTLQKTFCDESPYTKSEQLKEDHLNISDTIKDFFEPLSNSSVLPQYLDKIDNQSVKDCPVSSKTDYEDFSASPKTIKEVVQESLEIIDKDRNPSSTETNKQDCTTLLECVIEDCTSLCETVSKGFPASLESFNKDYPSSMEVVSQNNTTSFEANCTENSIKSTENVLEDYSVSSESIAGDWSISSESIAEDLSISFENDTECFNASSEVTSQGCPTLLENATEDCSAASEIVNVVCSLSSKVVNQDNSTSSKSIVLNHPASIEVIHEDCTASSESFVEDCPESIKALHEGFTVSSETLVKNCPVSSETNCSESLETTAKNCQFITENVSLETVSKDCIESLETFDENSLISTETGAEEYIASPETVSEACSQSSEVVNQVLPTTTESVMQNHPDSPKTLVKDCPVSIETFVEDYPALHESDPRLCSSSIEAQGCSAQPEENIQEYPASNEEVIQDYRKSNEMQSLSAKLSIPSKISSSSVELITCNNVDSSSEFTASNDDISCAKLTESNDDVTSEEPAISNDSSISAKIITVNIGVTENRKVYFPASNPSSAIETCFISDNSATPKGTPVCNIISSKVSKLKPGSSFQQLPSMKNLVRTKSSRHAVSINSKKHSVDDFYLIQRIFINIVILYYFVFFWAPIKAFIYFYNKKK